MHVGVEHLLHGEEIPSLSRDHMNRKSESQDDAIFILIGPPTRSSYVLRGSRIPAD